MTALPPNNFHLDTVQFKAYSRCQSLEDHAHSLQKDGLSPLVCARILGYMLKYGPTEEGVVTFAMEINDCHGDSALLALADEYSDNFIRCCEYPFPPYIFN